MGRRSGDNGACAVFASAQPTQVRDAPDRRGHQTSGTVVVRQNPWKGGKPTPAGASSRAESARELHGFDYVVCPDLEIDSALRPSAELRDGRPRR